RFVWGQPVLRWTILLIASSNFFSNVTFPLILFRMRNQLHFSGGLVGVVLGCEAAGGIAGSFVAGRLGRRFGMLPIALSTEMFITLTPIVFVVTDQAWIFALAWLIVGMGIVVVNVNILTLRQSITPDHMMSRMQGVARTIAWSLIPAGSIAGPALAIPLGLPAVLIIGSLVPAVMTFVIFLSPVRRLE
ncbi:MAG TPA: MFS transporter, partial [Ktedonobacterales bacterium]|nr:MFS transporter [Ktedonobacterales bacterium]